jgi:hypothetical protein
VVAVVGVVLAPGSRADGSFEWRSACRVGKQRRGAGEGEELEEEEEQTAREGLTTVQSVVC